MTAARTPGCGFFYHKVDVAEVLLDNLTGKSKLGDATHQLVLLEASNNCSLLATS
jgi:hypothetical protein